MSKKTTTNTRGPKTIKVKTLVIIGLVFVSLVASFVAGTITANGYNEKITNDALVLAKKLK